MRTPEPSGMLATLTAGLLALAIAVGAFAGFAAPVSIEHSHAANHHSHDDGHHHGHGHEEPSESPHDEHAPGDDRHHHHLNAPIPPAVCAADTSIWISLFSIPGYSGLPRSLPLPEGSYFDLIKPPQIV